MAYTAKIDMVAQLKNDLKAGNLKNVYTFYGEEEYLKSYYCKEITKKAVGKDSEFAVTEYDNSTFNIDTFLDDTENLSFSVENKVILLRNLNFDELTPQTKSVLIDTLKNISDSVFVILYYDSMFMAEGDYDKVRKRKQMIEGQNKYSFVVEFKPQKEASLIPWIINNFSAYSIDVDREIAQRLIFLSGSDMVNLKNEIKKIALCAKDKKVDMSLVDSLVSRSLETGIFDIAKNLVNKKIKTVMTILNDCKIAKESPTVILSSIFKTFNELLIAKTASDKGITSDSVIAKDFGIAPNRVWLFRDYRVLCKSKSLDYFKSAINEIYKTEMLMKGSNNDQWQCLEVLMMKIYHLAN